MGTGVADMAHRATYIGGSDAAAVAGVGLWGSPYSVWLSKVDPGEPSEPSERMRWGSLLEETIGKEWARQNGITNLRRGRFQRHLAVPYIGGHPDFTGDHPTDGKIVIEVKASDRASDWEDEVPIQYFLQVQHYLLVTGRPFGYLVVLLRGSELRSFRIGWDDDVISGLLETYRDFWSLVESKTPPPVDGHDATAEALKRRHPRSEDSEMVGDVLDQMLVRSWIEARKAKTEAVTAETEASNRLKERMGNVARLIVPGVTVSWKSNKPSVVTNWEAVAKAYRQMYEQARAEHGPVGVWITSAGLDAIESIHTDTVDGARVFRVTVKSEEE